MPIIQIVRFRLAPGVEESSFRSVNEQFQRKVVPTLPGLVRREATRSEDGEWVLVLRYTDGDSARKAGRSDASELSHAFMKMIDMPTMSTSFFDLVSE